MFDNTKSAIGNAFWGIKAFFVGLSLIFQAFTILFFVFAIVAKIGNPWINVVMCAVSIVYTIIYLVSKRQPRAQSKRLIAKAKRTRKWVKLALKLISLSITIYGMTIAMTNVVAIILATVSLFGWFLQVIFELLLFVIERKINKIKDGIKKDVA